MQRCPSVNLSDASSKIPAPRTIHSGYHLTTAGWINDTRPGNTSRFPGRRPRGGQTSIQLLAVAPNPRNAAGLSHTRITAALRRGPASPRRGPRRADPRRAAGPPAGPADPLVTAYAAIVRATAAVISTFNTQVSGLHQEVEAHFGRHRDAEIYRSQPGLGEILSARVLGEFDDDPKRFNGSGQQGLRRQQPDHARLGQEEDRHRPPGP